MTLDTFIWLVFLLLYSLTPSDISGGSFKMKPASHLLSSALYKNIAKSNFCLVPAAECSLNFVHPACVEI